MSKKNNEAETTEDEVSEEITVVLSCNWWDKGIMHLAGGIMSVSPSELKRMKALRVVE
jgi:hypothetical protein